MDMLQCYGWQVVHSKGVFRGSKVLCWAFCSVDELVTKIKLVL